MEYVFDESNIKILNKLVFDASVEYAEIVNNLNNRPIEFELDRRTFEAVKRSKSLFGIKTYFHGKRAKLTINGIKSVKIKNDDVRFRDNHFLTQIHYSEMNNAVIISTAFGLDIELKINSDFQIILADLYDSDFGKGISLGKHGFTKDEWTIYLKENKYTAQ